MNDVPNPWQSAVEPVAMRHEQFVFRGTTREYFGIWVVNILLTIVTLGIYSAWAKVRRQRYFYGNTYLAGSSFEYHARPVQILIGRIIVLVIIAAYNITFQVAPAVGVIFFLLLLVALPWFIVRGLRFNARVTSYRNVRFDFVGGYWGAFLAYIVGGMLTSMSAGILAPIASHWLWKYNLGNLRLGDHPVECDPRLDRIYRVWWMPALVMVGGLVVLGAVIGFIVYLLFQSSGTGDDMFSGTVMTALSYGGIVPFLALYAVCSLLYSAGVRNVAFNEAIINGRHSLESRVERWRYMWIAVTNVIVTLSTLGLARPWAAIRMTRYLAAVTGLYATTSLDEFTGSFHMEGGATGSEYMSVEGLDIGF